jgi:hypothetical protein
MTIDPRFREQSNVGLRAKECVVNMRKTVWCMASGLLMAGSAAIAQTETKGHEQHHGDQAEVQIKTQEEAMFRTPASIASEHRELHETLARAAREPGDLGVVARELESALAPHFKREEEIATPPLGLLPVLAKGDVSPEMKNVLPLTEALERELPQMLREHDAIRQAVSKFRTAAKRKGEERYVRFADGLATHAREEEEILYPAAILVGRYIARAVRERQATE